MPPEPRDAQGALAAWIRDPREPPPAGIDPRRLQVHADLVLGNLSGLLGPTFPVLRAVLGDDGWRGVIRDFLREHGARTPLFTELAGELLRYLDARAAAGRDDPPWLRELAHYERVELELQLSDARVSDLPHDPAGGLRHGLPLLSPLAWPLAYDWPVHRIAPGALPAAPAPTFLLLHRDAGGIVHFHRIDALAFHLLDRLGDYRTAASGDALLRALATEAGAVEVDAFVDAGLALLEGYRRDGIILGTRATG